MHWTDAVRSYEHHVVILAFCPVLFARSLIQIIKLEKHSESATFAKHVNRSSREH